MEYHAIENRDSAAVLSPQTITYNDKLIVVKRSDAATFPRRKISIPFNIYETKEMCDFLKEVAIAAVTFQRINDAKKKKNLLIMEFETDYGSYQNLRYKIRFLRENVME
jgi:hypothetical protein